MSNPARRIKLNERNNLNELSSNKNIIEIAKLFLKLGVTGFGGPAAHIAIMRREIVERKKWLSDERFLDLLGATNLIPGPNSTEMAIHLGHERGGWKGLVVAGISFIFPAVVITGFFAWGYSRYGQLPEMAAFVYGTKPAVIAVILFAIFPLAKMSAKSNLLKVIGVVVLIFSLCGFSEIFLMFAAGLLMLSIKFVQKTRSNATLDFLGLIVLAQGKSDFSNTINAKLFIIFIKIGAILYGSGYVLFAFLDSELVATGYLTRQELIDAIAVGQFTPGPVFSAVTFVGYQINGIEGALISTFAIFLPSFLFVALLNPVVRKLRSSDLFSSFLDAVNISSIAIIISVCYTMSKEVFINWQAIAIFAVAAILMVKFPKLNSAFIIIGGALLGYTLTLINL